MACHTALPCFTLGKAREGRIGGLRGQRGNIVWDKQRRREKPARSTSVDEALDSLIILYRSSFVANFSNLFAVTVLSPRFRRKSRGERRTTTAERGTGTRFPSLCAPQRTEKKRDFVVLPLQGICS